MTEKKRQKIWFLLNTIFTLIYLGWRVCFTIPIEHGIISTVSGIILIIVEILGAIEAGIHYFNMNDVRNPVLPTIPIEEYPDVDIFIATYNEDVSILYKTVNGCLHVDYPDRNKVHVYLCDDGKRKEVKDLAEKMGVNYLDRPDNQGAKAGNLNHALKKSSSPLVVTLDADMIPNHELLMKMVPYFVEEEIKNRTRKEKDKIYMGFVQSPQSFYNPDLFQFYLYSENRIPNEQDYFYKDVQVARNKSNSPIYGGSNTMLSRKALESIGGFFMDAITEDFATGILMQKAGFRCLAIREVLASGLSATTLKDLIQQRIRWGRGVISTSKKMHFILSRKLTIAQKINYLASLWYWYFPVKIFVYIMSPIMFAVFGYTVIDCTLPEILIFWLPMYIFSTYTLKLLSGNIRTGRWSRVYETVLFPFMLFPILLETFGISMKKFKVTSKGEADKLNDNLKYGIPFAIFLVLSVIGIVNCIRIIFITSSLSASVVLFWLLANSYSILMALFFVLGRKMVRKSERINAQIPCEIIVNGERIKGQTKDLSEEGMAVILNRPVFIDEEQEVLIILNDERYQCSMKVIIVYVGENNGLWRYAFHISKISEIDKLQYFQILYDRVPTLPENLENAISTFDDLRLNIKKRATATEYAKRSIVRVSIQEALETDKGIKVKVINFNYKFLAIETDQSFEKINIKISETLVLNCVYSKNIYKDLKLYSVNNLKDLILNQNIREELEHWLIEKNLSQNQKQFQEDRDKGERHEKKEFDERNYLT